MVQPIITTTTTRCGCCQPFGRIITRVDLALWYTCRGKNSQVHLLGMCIRFGCRKKIIKNYLVLNLFVFEIY